MPISYQTTRGASDAQRPALMEQNLLNTFEGIRQVLLAGGPWTTKRYTSSASEPTFSPGAWSIVLINPVTACSIILPDHQTCLGSWLVLKETAGSTNSITIQSLVARPAASPAENFVDGGFSLVMNTAKQALRLRAETDGWWAL